MPDKTRKAVKGGPILEALSLVAINARNFNKDALLAGPESFRSGTHHGIKLLTAKTDLLLQYNQMMILNMLATLENSSEHIRKKIFEKLLLLRMYLRKPIESLEQKQKPYMDRMLKSLSADTSNSQLRNYAFHNNANSDNDVSSTTANAAAYKPDLDSFLEGNKSAENTSSAGDKPKLYVPPKLVSTLPPDARKASRAKRLRAHDSIREFTDAYGEKPIEEPSIGSNFRKSGHSIASKLSKEKELEKRIEDYEESNYRRIHNNSKKSRKRLNFDSLDDGKYEFGGEVWSEKSGPQDILSGLGHSRKHAGSARYDLDGFSEKRGSKHATKFNREKAKAQRRLKKNRIS